MKTHRIGSDGAIATAPQDGDPGSEGGRHDVLVYRGRRWLALYLWLLGLLCATVGIASPAAGWFAVMVMAPITLVSGYVCLLIGWGEAVARVELRPDGFDLRLPRYRGYLPFWPARRLRAGWGEVTALRRRHVRARLLGLPFDYVAHTVETPGGRIMLFEPLPTDLFRNARGTGLNLPVPAIMAEFARRTGLAPSEQSAADGGGLWRTLAGRGFPGI